MDALLLVIRLALAGVFLVSAVAKLRDIEGTRKAVIEFGVPDRYSWPLAIALPVAELVAVALLLITRTAWFGALAVLILLAIFTAAIIKNLVAGKTPDCHCFGQIHSEPIGPSTLVRNGALAVAAIFVLLFGWGGDGASAYSWLGDLTNLERAFVISQVVVIFLLALLAWTMFQTVRQGGRLLLRLDDLDARIASAPGTNGAPEIPTPLEPEIGLSIGNSAPAFSLNTVYGQSVALADLLENQQPVLLLFTSPTCGPCAALMPDVSRWQKENAESLTVAVIGQGEVAANRAKAAEHALTSFLVQETGEVSLDYGIPGTPAAVVVGVDGLIATGTAAGSEAIRELVRSLIIQPTVEPNLAQSGGSEMLVEEESEMSEPALESQPESDVLADSSSLVDAEQSRTRTSFELPDLNGDLISSDELIGEPTILLFWSPTCGFCERMIDDVKAWEENPPEDAPRLFIVSSGTEEENRAQGLKARIVLDQEFATAGLFGATGTPSAILLDSEGTIVGDLAVGSPNVVALMYGREYEAPEPAPEPIVLEVGQTAPEFELPDLDGNATSLSEFRGKDTVILFWSPSCVHCQRMLDDIQEFDANPQEAAPAFLVITSGNLESNQAANLRSKMLMDEEGTVSALYGAAGTPNGIRIDAEGNVASLLARGAGPVMALTGFVTKACQECLDACREQGGGAACEMICRMNDTCY